MITKDILRKICPRSREDIIENVALFFNKHAKAYDMDTYLRMCHFFAQAAHESASFKTLEEYASGQGYEGRKDLGNVKVGDGKRFKGRGIFQLTGRNNYKTYGDLLKIDLINDPALAETPEVSVLTAFEYWKKKGLSKFADEDDITTITKKINGGYNGFEDRKRYLAKAKTLIPKNQTYAEKPKVEVKIEPIVVPKIDALNIIMAKKGDKSNYILDLQEMLIRKGFEIIADGNFGKKTELAVSTFQKNMQLNVTGKINTNTLTKLMEA